MSIKSTCLPVRRLVSPKALPATSISPRIPIDSLPPLMAVKTGNFAADKHQVFKELRLKELPATEESMGRVRQHVNPLALKFQFKTPAPEWDQIFSDPTLPLVIDAGSGYGRFALISAKNEDSPTNYLGTDIRQPIVVRANRWAKETDLDHRVHFIFANITISLESLVEGYPGDIKGIYIQFPDPCFKKRTVKRHIIQPDFVQSCVRVLKPGGLVFMQSDVLDCAVYGRRTFDKFGQDSFVPHQLHHPLVDKKDLPEDLIDLRWESLMWLEDNPIGFPTEREVYTIEKGDKVYRMLLVKT